MYHFFQDQITIPYLVCLTGHIKAAKLRIQSTQSGDGLKLVHFAKIYQRLVKEVLNVHERGWFSYLYKCFKMNILRHLIKPKYVYFLIALFSATDVSFYF